MVDAPNTGAVVLLMRPQNHARLCTDHYFQTLKGKKEIKFFIFVCPIFVRSLGRLVMLNVLCYSFSYAKLYNTIPYYTKAHYTTIHYTTIHYTTPHYITLHYYELKNQFMEFRI
mgnify:CR=1 FL=1